MDHQPAGIEFAVIGHQDSWETVMQFVKTMRFANNGEELSLKKVQEIFTYIPPRKLFDIEVNSAVNGKIKGVYIETFIAPDELDIKHLRKNIDKVRKACELAAKLGASVVSLGGFSSIVLETGNESFSKIGNTCFTTGNTLTAAFIAKGVEKACAHWDVKLQNSCLLIIGSTGDIGSACVRYFSGRVKELLLCARQPGPLQKQSGELSEKGIQHTSSHSLKELVPKADIVISVASSIIDNNDLDMLPGLTIVCDAGYPKNLQNTKTHNHERLFYGGMGIVTEGFYFENNARDILYKFSMPDAGHGCLLESIVLAMENEYAAYSKGKNNINVQSMEKILAMAAKHGIYTAPLFNSHIITETKTAYAG